MEARIRSICPDTVVHAHNCFYLPETADRFDFTQYDYVADAIDTVSGKLQLALQAHEANVPIISAMGAGNKLDPTAFRVSDISKTSMDPLAKVLRKTLRKEEIRHFKVVYSEEKAAQELGSQESGVSRQIGKLPLPSCAFVPAACGLVVGGEVVRNLAGL